MKLLLNLKSMLSWKKVKVPALVAMLGLANVLPCSGTTLTYNPVELTVTLREPRYVMNKGRNRYAMKKGKKCQCSSFVYDFRSVEPGAYKNRNTEDISRIALDQMYDFGMSAMNPQYVLKLRVDDNSIELGVFGYDLGGSDINRFFPDDKVFVWDVSTWSSQSLELLASLDGTNLESAVASGSDSINLEVSTASRPGQSNPPGQSNNPPGQSNNPPGQSNKPDKLGKSNQPDPPGQSNKPMR